MVVQGEAPLPQEHQGHEGDRQRHQQEGEFVDGLLQLVERQVRVLQLLGDGLGQAVGLAVRADAGGDVRHLGLPAARGQTVLAALDRVLLQTLQLGLLSNHAGFSSGQSAGGGAGPRAAVERRGRAVRRLHRRLRRIDFLAGGGGDLLRFDYRLLLGLDLLRQGRQRHRLMRHEAEGEEHDEQGEQEHRQRRDVAGPLTLHPFAGQPPRIEDQQRQGAPQTAVEMHDPVQQLFAQMQQGAVDMGRLAAVGAEVARDLGPAVSAGAVSFARMARRLLDRPGDDARRHRSARRFQIHAVPPQDSRRTLIVWRRKEKRRRLTPTPRSVCFLRRVFSAARPTRWRCGRCGSGPRPTRSNLRRSDVPCRS